MYVAIYNFVTEREHGRRFSLSSLELRLKTQGENGFHQAMYYLAS